MPAPRSNDIHARLGAGTIDCVYLLTGDELFLIDQALAAIVKRLNADPLNKEVFAAGDSPLDDILLAVQTLPFLGDKRLVIVKDCQRLKPADIERLAQFIVTPVPSTVLVLVWPERSKREGKAYALSSAVAKNGLVADFKPLYERDLPEWVSRMAAAAGKKISRDATLRLIDESGSNLLDLSNELGKLVLYSGARKEITAEDVASVSGHTRLDNLNTLAEALESRNGAKTVSIAERLITEGEPALRVLSAIHRVVRRLLTAKSMMGERKSSHQDIRQELRLHVYFDRDFFSNLARFDGRELERGLASVLAADVELKSSARPDTMVVGDLLLLLCGQRVHQA